MIFDYPFNNFFLYSKPDNLPNCCCLPRLIFLTKWQALDCQLVSYKDKSLSLSTSEITLASNVNA